MTLALPGHGNTAHSAVQPLRLWFGLSVATGQASEENCLATLADLRRLNERTVGKVPPAKVELEYSEPTIVVKNSFCRLSAFPPEVTKQISDLLTYKDDGVEKERLQAIRLIHLAKARKNKKMLWLAAKKLEELKGKDLVCWLRGSQFPTGHLRLVVDELAETGFKFDVLDERVVPQAEHLFRWAEPPPELRYYQKEMVELGLQEYRGVFEASVASGKSWVLAHLIKRLGVTSLVVLPSSALLEQLSQMFVRYFGSSKVQEVTTKAVEAGKISAPIRLTTVQTLASMTKKGLMPKLVKDVNLLAIDEVHHAGSVSFTNLLPHLDDVFYRFGFTGTFLRNDSKTLDMWGFLSCILYHYPPYRATAEGFTTPVEFVPITLPGVRNRNYQKEYSENYLGQPALLKKVHELVARRIPAEEQVLILVDRKESGGFVIHGYLQDRGVETTYISGDDSKEVIAQAIQDFNDKKIRVLVGSQVIGEGIDLHSTQHLIMARGGKSEIAVIQAVGRCMRLSPGKTKSYVYDLNFEGTRFLEKHFQIRQTLYRNWFAQKGASDETTAQAVEGEDP